MRSISGKKFESRDTIQETHGTGGVRGDVLSVFQTPGFFTNLEPDQPGVCTVGRGGGRGKGEREPIAEPISSVQI